MKKKQLIEEDEITITELIEKIKSIFKRIFSNWRLVFTFSLIGGVIGLSYAYIQPKKYSSKVTFVVEENSTSIGGIASLAGQFGLDFGTNSSGSLFSGENVLLFLKSENLLRKTLLTNYDSIKHLTLADKYAEVKNLKKKWKRSKDIGHIDFDISTRSILSRKEDSLLQVMIEDIKKDDLLISKPDKKASFIEVRVTMQDEMLSKYFSERLVSLATESYLQSKIKYKASNVILLQRKADSLGALLNDKTYNAAVSQQILVDANPGLRLPPISAEISSRDKAIASTMFAEVIKNLELSKTILSQETPVIQIVDQSSLPLKVIKVSKTNSLVLGVFLSGFITILYLLVSQWIKFSLSNK